MNKITRKQPVTLYYINECRLYDKEYNPTPKKWNQEMKNRKYFYQLVIKKKLGKAKRENE